MYGKDTTNLDVNINAHTSKYMCIRQVRNDTVHKSETSK